VSRGTVTAGASYLARRLVVGKREEVRVCGPDEDAVTLALEAAQRSIEVWGGDIESFDALYLAIGHGSFVEGPHAQFLTEGLGLSNTCSLSTFSGESLAGLSALISAMDAVETGRLSTVLVIATEGGGARSGISPSAAAAAVIVEAVREGASVSIEEVGQISSVKFDRWRSSLNVAPSRGDNRYLQDRNISEVQTLVDRIIPESKWKTPIMTAFCGAHRNVRKEVLSLNPELKDSGAGLGDYGTASPFLAILEEISVPEATEFLLLAQGTSRHVALRVSSTGGCSEKFLSDQGKHPILTEAGSIVAHEPKLSLPTYSPFYARNCGELIRLDAAKCSHCDWVAFPASLRPICPQCKQSSWNSYRLPRSGIVYSFTINRFLPSGFGDEMAFVLGELDDGNMFWAPVSDLETTEIEIGLPVWLTVRRFSKQDGVPVYGMKFVGTDTWQSNRHGQMHPERTT